MLRKMIGPCDKQSNGGDISNEEDSEIFQSGTIVRSLPDEASSTVSTPKYRPSSQDGLLSREDSATNLAEVYTNSTNLIAISII
jgi:hypothetical protein